MYIKENDAICFKSERTGRLYEINEMMTIGDNVKTSDIGLIVDEQRSGNFSHPVNMLGYFYGVTNFSMEDKEVEEYIKNVVFKYEMKVEFYLQQYVSKGSVLEFNNQEEILRYFKEVENLDFSCIEDLEFYQDMAAFKWNGKYYHILDNEFINDLSTWEFSKE